VRLDAGSRLKTSKAIGTGLAVLFAVIVLPLLFIYGIVWFSEKALPWLILASAIVFATCLLVLLPLSIFRKVRPWTGLGLFFASFLFGTMLFAFSCLVVLQLWGGFGLVVGLVLGGLGVVPVAFLAALFHGEWALLGFVVLGIVVTYGTRMLGIRLVESIPDEEYKWPEQVSDGAVLNPEADELAESIEAQLVSYEHCTVCGGKGTKEPSGRTCEVCEGSGMIYEEEN
jgi:hypothetical protein